MATVYENEIRQAGLDPNVIRRIANGIERYAKEAQKHGITVYGGSTCGSLRFSDDRSKTQLIIAIMLGSWDGGDGGDGHSNDGFFRGE